MKVGQAVGILIQAVKVAQKNGTYTLEEAAVIQKAVETLTVTKTEEIKPKAEEEAAPTPDTDD